MNDFLWDIEREAVNIAKHGVDFSTAALVFNDPQRKVFIDLKHSQNEDRMICIGKLHDKVLTVRFIYRDGKIRIFGAGYWRKGKDYYEKEFC